MVRFILLLALGHLSFLLNGATLHLFVSSVVAWGVCSSTVRPFIHSSASFIALFRCITSSNLRNHPHKAKTFCNRYRISKGILRGYIQCGLLTFQPASINEKNVIKGFVPPSDCHLLSIIEFVLGFREMTLLIRTWEIRKACKNDQILTGHS